MMLSCSLVVEQLLEKNTYDGIDKDHPAPPPKNRDKWKAVAYRVPHNAAVQIYDYKLHKPRVVFGPELVMLEPDELFTVLQLSGGTPKEANQITSLNLMLGPDFMNDQVPTV